MSRMNALHNCRNPYQGTTEKVLTVCSAGLLRSPTVANILQRWGYNTRAAGVHDYALVQVDDVLLQWADTIVFVSDRLKDILEHDYVISAVKRVVILDIPDDFPYGDPALITLAARQLVEHFDKRQAPEWEV